MRGQKTWMIARWSLPSSVFYFFPLFFPSFTLFLPFLSSFLRCLFFIFLYLNLFSSLSSFICLFSCFLLFNSFFPSSLIFFSFPCLFSPLPLIFSSSSLSPLHFLLSSFHPITLSFSSFPISPPLPLLLFSSLLLASSHLITSSPLLSSSPLSSPSLPSPPLLPPHPLTPLQPFIERARCDSPVMFLFLQVDCLILTSLSENVKSRKKLCIYWFFFSSSDHEMTFTEWFRDQSPSSPPPFFIFTEILGGKRGNLSYNHHRAQIFVCVSPPGPTAALTLLWNIAL